MQNRVTAEMVEAGLTTAGLTLLTMHVGGLRPAGYRSAWPEVVRDAYESYGWDATRIRPSPPLASDITAMDAIWRCLLYILLQKRVIRRVVGMRALTNPRTLKPLLSWRFMGDKLGCSHSAVRLWHGQGIDIIAAGLNRPVVDRSVRVGLYARSGGPIGPNTAQVAAAIEAVWNKGAVPASRQRERA